ncbi:glutathione S-transferase family protein [Roseibium litorale]|uniref:Glutathione S-transferase family protein n=1 Tax=Roseibium litorale TaxID=2803841 RepID=A0ABR9CKQ1_9HYPH|nr:glutathione S-transferase family protein [Roseibium litorale]MBD8891420.1 glutathione S-transferase family protein [Roseibium litorale]
MPVLRSSPPSPFGRKIKIAAKLLDLMDKITIEVADTANPEDSLRGQNPLGKIPALVLDDGSVLYDSRVITEYLDFMAGGNRLLPEGEARFPVLRLQALSDGIVDASILQVYEKRFKPEEFRFPDWLAYQQAKVTRGLDWLEGNTPPPLTSAADADAGSIALACALGYLDLRFAGEWREGRPNLTAWLDSFDAAVPAFAETRLDPAPIPAAVAQLR